MLASRGHRRPSVEVVQRRLIWPSPASWLSGDLFSDLTQDGLLRFLACTDAARGDLSAGLGHVGMVEDQDSGAGRVSVLRFA